MGQLESTAVQPHLVFVLLLLIVVFVKLHLLLLLLVVREVGVMGQQLQRQTRGVRELGAYNRSLYRLSRGSTLTWLLQW